MIKNYYKPTPVKWRKFGDSCLAVGTMITTGGLLGFDQIKDVFGDHLLKVIIGCAFLLGVAGKFMSNFFKEDPAEKSEPSCSDGQCNI